MSKISRWLRIKFYPPPPPPLQKKNNNKQTKTNYYYFYHIKTTFSFEELINFYWNLLLNEYFGGFFIIVFISIVKFELIYSDLKFKWPFFFFSECCGCNERWAYPTGWIAADRWLIQNFIRYRFSRELFICTYKLALIKILT